LAKKTKLTIVNGPITKYKDEFNSGFLNHPWWNFQKTYQIFSANATLYCPADEI